MIKLTGCLVGGILAATPVMAGGGTAEKLGAVEKQGAELDPNLVSLPVFRIPVIQNRSLKTYYLIDMRLLAVTPEKANLIFKKRSLLIDAFFQDLYGVLGVSWNPKYHIHLPSLKKRLCKIGSAILGAGVIDRILIQQFNIQKTRQKKSKGP